MGAIHPLPWRQVASCSTSKETTMTDFEGVEFCAYCLEERNDKRSCCQENHWVEYKDLDEESKNLLKESK
jgi:hypothetical protein